MNVKFNIMLESGLYMLIAVLHASLRNQSMVGAGVKTICRCQDIYPAQRQQCEIKKVNNR